MDQNEIREGAVDQNVGYQGFGSEQLDPIQVQVIPVSSLNVGLNSIISITGQLRIENRQSREEN